MKSLLKALFINHWPRKFLSLFLAVTVWSLVNKSLTVTKSISHIPVRIENIPPGKTIDGIQANGQLSHRVNLTVTGKKQLIEDLNPQDLQVILDAQGHEGEWIATIGKKNLFSANPDLNLSQGISRLVPQNIVIKMTKLASEKIPIMITQPIGESPQGYQYLDIWPYQLYITVSGPEEQVKQLKTKGVKLTFNLNDISRNQLDELSANHEKLHSDVVSFYIPNSWKQISIPMLTSTPIEINDPDAKYLRIDFIRYEMLKIDSPLPVNLYFSPEAAGSINPSKVTLAPSTLIENRNGLRMVTEPLYAKGVSALFLSVVKNMVELAIIVRSGDESSLQTSIQFINAKELEERYIRDLKSDATDDEVRDLQPQMRDAYLRNRFRNFMNRFRIYTSTSTPFILSPKLQGNTITVTERKEHAP